MNIRNPLLKFCFAFLLIILLFGYKYIINIPQSLQDHIMNLHQIPTTHFNLLYSLQTLPTMFLIIPLGILYDSFGPKMLIPASFLLVIGQFILYIYTPLKSSFSFIMMIIGRVFQGIGAEILYLGQGSLATKWMGNLVGMIVVLPQIGQIANVFLSPILYINGGLSLAMFVGLIFCIVSAISSLFLFWLDKKCDKEYKQILQKKQIQESQIKCSTLKDFSKLFWILILICAINQSIYLPFMDNANTLIRLRFCVQYSQTGQFLCLPFIAAMISTGFFGYLLKKFSKKKLAIISGLIGVLSHYFIYKLHDCQNKNDTNFILVCLAFIIFGIGFGSYYAIIYPLVGLSVKKQYRGTAYAMVSFVQAIGMTIIPELSALIIEKQKIQSEGYKKSSLLFIFFSLIGLILSLILSSIDNDILNRIGGDEQQYKKVMNQTQLNPMSTTPTKHEIQNKQIDIIDQVQISTPH